MTSEAGGTAIVHGGAQHASRSADVSIGLSSSDAGEGSVAPASLTFGARDWNVPQTVTVTGVDDPIDDGNIPTASSPPRPVSADPGYNGLNAANVSVTNVDNDSSGVTVSPVAGTRHERGGRHRHLHGGADAASRPPT